MTSSNSKPSLCAPAASCCTGRAQRPSTSVGPRRSCVSPKPSCPLPLRPQAYTWEVAVTHRVWKRPQMTCVTICSCSILMERGFTQSVSALSPWPHWPYSLEPQVMTSSGVMAMVCSAPQEMALAAWVVAGGGSGGLHGAAGGWWVLLQAALCWTMHATAAQHPARHKTTSGQRPEPAAGQE